MTLQALMNRWSLPLIVFVLLRPVSAAPQRDTRRPGAAYEKSTQGISARPFITGVSHLAIYATDPIKTGAFYQHQVGCGKAPDFEDHPGVRYLLNAEQYIEVMPLPSSAGADRLDHIAFRTSDVDAMVRFLLTHGVPVPDAVHKSASGIRWLEVKDFEGNKVQFVEDSKPISLTASTPTLVGHRMIHLGMAIRNRAEADSFYRDVLGFHLYWSGGVDPERTDWVSMQVPDGTDWLEYMLTSGPSGSGIPYRISQQALGVLNHFSIGVTDMQVAVAKLKGTDRVSSRSNGPRIGHDGKWQFNDLDPDGTRVEYMEFTPKEKPCCSEFSAPHPSASAE